MREKKIKKGLGFSTIILMLLLSMSAIVLLPRPNLEAINIDKTNGLKLELDKETYIYTEKLKNEKLLLWRFEPEQPSVISYEKVDKKEFLIKIITKGRFDPVYLIVANLKGDEQRVELYYELIEAKEVVLDHEIIIF